MIISCPNCSARYRLAVTVIAENTRMRCAACDHRWVVEADEPVELPAPTPAERAPVAPEPASAPEPAPAPEPDPETGDAGGSPMLRTLAAVVVGGALAIAAGALWVARIDPGTVPVLGDSITALAPAPVPLKIAFNARTTPLDSGELLLQVSGTVRNTGTATIALPDLEARLATPSSTVRRWRISAPVARLAPGASVAFTTTATGFPADATIMGIRPAG